MIHSVNQGSFLNLVYLFPTIALSYNHKNLASISLSSNQALGKAVCLLEASKGMVLFPSLLEPVLTHRF